MTGKRFWYDFEDCNGPKIIDFKKDKEYPLETIGDFRGIEELLNELSENLTGCNKTANNAIDTIKALTKENEQLKKEIGNLEHTKEFCAECCERL